MNPIKWYRERQLKKRNPQLYLWVKIGQIILDEIEKEDDENK